MGYDQFGNWTATNPQAGNQAWDFSGIQSGLGALQNAPQYQAQRSNSFQYSNPSVGSVQSRSLVGGPAITGRRQSAGPYGTSSASDVSSAYTTGFGAAATPIMAQGAARMRGLSQGFEGGRLTGGARGQLALRNAQQTGSDLRQAATQLGGDISQRMLSQQETARGQDYGERQNIEQDYQAQRRARDTGMYDEQMAQQSENLADRRSMRDMNYQSELTRQNNQANEDFRQAGFSDQQARYATDQAMQRAMYLLGSGFALPQLQSSLYGSMLGGYDRMQQLGNVTNGTNG